MTESQLSNRVNDMLKDIIGVQDHHGPAQGLYKGGKADPCDMCYGSGKLEVQPYVKETLSMAKQQAFPLSVAVEGFAKMFKLSKKESSTLHKNLSDIVTNLALKSAMPKAHFARKKISKKFKAIKAPKVGPTKPLGRRAGQMPKAAMDGLKKFQAYAKQVKKIDPTLTRKEISILWKQEK